MTALQFLGNFTRILFALIVAFVGLPSAMVSAELHTVSAVGEYTMSDYEEPQIAEQRALDYARRNAAEQAGVYIESYTKTKNMQISEDEVNAIASSKINVISKNVSRELDAENNIRIRIGITATVDTVDVDEVLAQNSNEHELFVEKYKAIQKAALEQDKKISVIKQKLSLIPVVDINYDEQFEQQRADREFMSLENTKLADREKNIKKKIDLLDKAIRLNPKNSMAYIMLAKAHAEWGKEIKESSTDDPNREKSLIYVVSSKAFIAEILNPERRIYHEGSGGFEILMQLGCSNDVEFDYLRNKYYTFLSRGIKRFKRDVFLYFDRAELFSYEKDGSQHPTEVAFIMNYGRRYILADYFTSGKTFNEQQIKDYTSTLDVAEDWELAETFCIPHMALSSLIVHGRNGGQGIDWPHILNLFDKAIERNPRRIGLYLNKAEIYRLLNNKQGWIDAYQKIINLNLEPSYNNDFLKMIQEIKNSVAD